jgi:hypothetical protein
MKRATPGTFILLLMLGLAGLVAFSTGAEQPRTDNALPEAHQGHRVLRDNAAGPPPAPTEPQTFSGFPEAPEFSVSPREVELSFYPCATCHEPMPTNATVRKLYAPHPAALNHGDGRFWCLDCHAPEERNQLQLLSGEQLGFNDAWQLCGQCHYQPQKDWAHGGHGKRVSNWQGGRELYNCTHCHDPHDPGIKARAPEPPPPVRYGLAPMPTADHPDTTRENDD